MATRVVEIRVTGESGNFEATVQRITDRTNAMQQAAIKGTQQWTATLSGLPNLLNQIAGSMGIAFGVGSVVAFGKRVLDAAGQIDDLAKRTGFARQTLSGIKNTIEESGGSLLGFATAINRAQRSLADVEGEGKKAAVALSAMGLNVAELTRASPEKFFETFAQALSKVEDQNTRVGIAMRVMGRAGAEQIPVILDLADGFSELRKTGLSDETIKRLDAIGDAMTRAKNATLDWGASLIFYLAKALDKTIQQIRDLKLSLSALGPAKPGAIAGGIAGIDIDQFIKPKPVIGGPLDLSDKADTAAKKAANERLQFLEQLKDKLRGVQAQFEGLSDPQKAALTQLSELEEKAKKFNDPAMRNLVETIKLYTLAVIEKNKEDERQKAIVEQVAAINKNLSESEAAEITRKQNIRDEIEAEFALKEKLFDLDVERLRILGLEDAAARQQLENIIKLNIERRAAIEAADIDRKAGELAELDKRTANAQLRLNQLGKTSIDVVGEVTRAATDIVNAAINGTLKVADIGKSIMGTFVRFAIEQMSTFFRQMAQQQQNAQIAANAGVMLPSGSSGSGGGILQSMLGNLGGGGGGLGNLFGLFGGGRPAGVSGPLMANGGFFSGGGGFGGLGAFGGLADMGLQFGGLFGASQIGSGGPLGVGGQITGQIASTVLTSSLSAMLGGSGGILGTLLPALMPMLSNPITAIIAAIIVAITSIFGAQKPNPGVMVRSRLEGFNYDPDINQFLAGGVRSTARGLDGIDPSAVSSTRTAVQQILEGMSEQWVEILNLFPVIVHDKMIPRLEATNALLNTYFGRLKFTEGGSNTIQEEIQRLAERTGPEGFFHALRGTIGAGIAATIQRAGLGDLSALVDQSFSQVPEGSDFLAARNRLPGLKAPRRTEDVEPFFQAIGKFVGITSGLAGVSNRGITPFLTESDLATVEKRISAVLKITDGKQFTQAVENLEQQLKPVTDFLQKSLQETAQIFGGGLMAALDAATASQAMDLFKQSLGSGIKDVIFKGITESFIASAQFNDLLAPIQKIIREFTQEAINTGEAPDIAAFRRAILPGIEDIATRADVLAPLIAELQKLGIDIKDALRIFGGAAGTLGGDINITIGQIDSEERADYFARRIEELLRPALPPPT